jgi:hypothetical protein
MTHKFSSKSLLTVVLFLAACGGKKGDNSADSVALPVNGGLGFYSLQTSGLPSGVVTASESVFELRVISDDGDTGQIMDVSRGRGAKEKRRILAMPESRLDANAKIVIVKQIEFCESHDVSHQKACPVYSQSYQASGFVMGDGSTLWTSAHAIEPFMNFVEKTQEVSKRAQFAKHQRVGVFIFNNVGQLIVNPFVEAVTLGRAPRASNFARLAGNFYAQDSDYITLQLSRPIAKPLHFTVAKPVPAQRVFVVGYPACTGCVVSGSADGNPLDFADRSPAPNSDGKGLKVSYGEVIPNDAASQFLGVSPLVLSNWDLQAMVLSNADTQHGQSGGPTLNEAGEVVGVHAGGKMQMTNGVLRRLSHASFPRVVFP